MTTTKLMRIGAVLGALIAGGALAEGLPRLPQPLQLPQGADSPGVVTFRHDSHLDAKRPACVECHAGRFSILGRSGERPGAKVTHAAMEKGEACGACHGKQAFGFDDCTTCHAQ
ncbi:MULTISPECIES: c(7)-type cytochrome triheme domain-containing protein [Anaeromyxobacter]|uniref:c(7)-type cytochrome triheme domain-containing protein n=1 Tax=Anaeromyxobacter TaxID=161492 RepID=UPI001F598FA2|nr:MULTISPECIES: c(7)-type cytochrome triheme domain-containing protein [unclassified Anaeromyxobacter]